MTPRLLTKSRFKQAMECPNKLFYTRKKEYANRKLEDSFLEALAQGGFQVEELARMEYPEGILIEGNESVPDYVVRRELPLQVGQRFSQQKMIEGQRELFGLDLFRVAVADVPEQERDNTVTVRYVVREAKLRVVRAQTGYGFEDGIVLSNHGGRQLDRAPVPFHLLPHVVREVGKDATVMVDTGIMNGADIVASVALGAKFTLIGRAYLYGLMAGGEAMAGLLSSPTASEPEMPKPSTTTCSESCS